MKQIAEHEIFRLASPRLRPLPPPQLPEKGLTPPHAALPGRSPAEL